MRKINLIILHCTGTAPDPNLGASGIDHYHKSLGWVCIGYHFVIRTDGRLERGRPVEAEGAHCLYHNKESIGVCYVGGTVEGKNIDTRTAAQNARLEILVKDLLKQYPDAKVAGHHDFDKYKDCPCFDVAQWCESIGIPQKNIYHGE